MKLPNKIDYEKWPFHKREKKRYNWNRKKIGTLRTLEKIYFNYVKERYEKMIDEDTERNKLEKEQETRNTIQKTKINLYKLSLRTKWTLKNFLEK